MRAAEGDNRLIERLEARGAVVQLVTAYQTVFGEVDSETLKAAADCDCVMLASASAARNFAEILPGGTDFPPAVSIGPVTTEAAETLGFRVIGEAAEPTVEALAAKAVSVIASPSTLAG
jgi:uroporphyrinogen-III synthase